MPTSLYNGMIDKRPRLIARAVDAADVIAAVNFAREQGLLLAIRGGGHNGPGLGSCDDGLVIDLSMMKGVRVDRSRQFGDVYLALALWRGTGLADLCEKLLPVGKEAVA